jgi:hypothetical protein
MICVSKDRPRPQGASRRFEWLGRLLLRPMCGEYYPRYDPAAKGGEPVLIEVKALFNAT